MSFARLSLMLALLSGSPVFGHEFWIEPEQYHVESGAPLVAALKNGENFKGSSLAWFDSRFTRFEIASGDQILPVTGRMGDTPALQSIAPQDGLLIVLHETTPSSLTYREWEKFLKFVEHKDFSTAVAVHDDRAWPKTDFRETYTRHVKALIAVGHGEGSDRAFDMETEIIAITNPYDQDFNNQMHVEVTYQGVPRSDAQIEVFARAPDGTVEVSLARTDASGRALIAVEPGFEYLFDAVVLRPAPQAGSSETAPLWETLWAALTFAVPAK